MRGRPCAYGLLIALAGCAAHRAASSQTEPSRLAADTVSCGEASDEQLQAFDADAAEGASTEAMPRDVSEESLDATSSSEQEQVASPQCVLTDDSYAAGFARKLGAAEAQLEQTLAASACEQVCELAASVCALSARICELAARSPQESVQARCDDGRARCERARERSSQRCGCVFSVD